MKRQLRKAHGDESGQVITYFVAMLIITFGIMSLAIDIGFFFHARRIAQNAADAAAIAGATELLGCGDMSPDPLVIADEYADANLEGKTFQTSSDVKSLEIRQFETVEGSGIYWPTVYVLVERPQNYVLARFLGLPLSSAVKAEAEAVCAPATGGGVCPFAIVAPNPGDEPQPGSTTAYGIEKGRVYMMKADAQGGANGNFQILKLIEGSATETYRDFVASGCEDPDSESAVIVEEGDGVCGTQQTDETCVETTTGNKSGPTAQALDGDCKPICGLYLPEHTYFPNIHKDCNVPFVIDGVLPGSDPTSDKDDTPLGTVTVGGVPVATASMGVDIINAKTASSLCDAIDGPLVIDDLLYPAVQGRFMQIVLIDQYPSGSSTPVQALGILRMYIVCWTNQDGGAGECGDNVPPGQYAIFGVFGEYYSPNLLKVVGAGNSPLAPKHVVLVK